MSIFGIQWPEQASARLRYHLSRVPTSRPNRLETRTQYKVAGRKRGTIQLLTIIGLLLSLLFPPMTAFAQVDPPVTAAAAQMSDYLADALTTTQESVSFLILLRDQVDAAEFVAERAVQAASRAERATQLYHELTMHAQASQAPLRAWLDEQGVAYRAFYLINMIEVEGDFALATALLKRPEVAELVANPLVSSQLTVPSSSMRWMEALSPLGIDEAEATAAVPYGLEYTHAVDVWQLGYTGKGIIVASQDTGVEWDHPALQPAYRGIITATQPTTLTALGGTVPQVSHVYNWYDAWGLAGRPPRCVQDAQIPCDDHGHGTHTVGTMLGDATDQGDSILGMAPDAQWIGCRNMREGFGTPASYTACFEFFLAPYPQGGDPFTDGRPDLAPHIINNSWGCPPSEGCDANSLRQVVETMRAAGQMVVASAGNDGPNCTTVHNPISMHDAVLSVGAHNSAGAIASFSSRGPVTADGSNRLKPDISAPGVAVRSTWLNAGYNTIQGTSMASPHVAGAVALLWSAVPTLIGDIDATEQILLKSATPVSANNCGEGDVETVPNNTYGYGRLNILAAVEMAKQPTGLTIAVVDTQNRPVDSQLLTVIDQLTGYHYQAKSGFNGIAHLLLTPGEYTVEVEGVQRTQMVALQAGQTSQATVVKSSFYLPFVVR